MLLAKGLEVKLTASPRILFMHPMQSAAYVMVTAVVRDPDRMLGCHAVAWDWGDGCYSSQESDCDPEDELPALYVYRPKPHPYRSPGVYTVRVSVCRNLDDGKCKDTKSLGEVVLFVKGDEDDEDPYVP